MIERKKIQEVQFVSLSEILECAASVYLLRSPQYEHDVTQEIMSEYVEHVRKALLTWYAETKEKLQQDPAILDYSITAGTEFVTGEERFTPFNDHNETVFRIYTVHLESDKDLSSRQAKSDRMKAHWVAWRAKKAAKKAVP